MKCPICDARRLHWTELEADLPAYICETCEGIWISAARYWSWLKHQVALSPEVPMGTAPVPIEGVNKAKICPDCGHLLRRYKVWPAVQFYLDRCGHCQGVWFDKDEWAVLVSRHLHTQVHMFFTEEWQAHLLEEESRRRLDHIYLERFGAEDYERLKEIRAWLDARPYKGALLAYLMSKDPYRALLE